VQLGVNHINLSDTIGVANKEDISKVFTTCQKEMSDINFGAHFHTRPDNYLQNISAAYEAGCRSFDSAIKGFGGCPFASDKLTGNLPTESLISYLNHIGEPLSIKQNYFDEAYMMAGRIFV